MVIIVKEERKIAYKKEGRVSRPGSMKKKSLYEKGYWPLSSINIPGKCDETVVKR